MLRTLATLVAALVLGLLLPGQALAAPSPIAPPLTLALVPDVRVEQGEAVLVRVEVAGGVEPYAFSASGLPGWLRIDAATGVLGGLATQAGSTTARVEVRDAAGAVVGQDFEVEVTARPTLTPSPSPEPTWTPSAPYTLQGLHTVNSRLWLTLCEPYSQTYRCRTSIWATTVAKAGSGYAVVQGWAFNNLTYLPYLKRAQWSGNPLGATGEWTATDGRRWRTECDTPATGADACRTYTMTTVVSAVSRPGGGYRFEQSNQWVFNSMVLFGR